MTVGIIGGTGPAGRGLAVRLAAAGHEVVIGSRDPARAASIAGDLTERWGDRLVHPPKGGANLDAAASPTVVVATPWESAVATVRVLADALAGKVVISMVNALVREGREMVALIPGRGSMAGALAGALPGATVIGAFHHLPATQMENLDSGLVADVLIFGDSTPAKVETVSLVDTVAGLRGLDAGSMAQGGAIEAFTAVCITLNISQRAHSTVQMAGLPGR